MVPVKICGITRLEDAELAAQFGASWVGFVFWRASPRFVEPSAARNILSRLPPHVTGVGVFVNQAIDEVNEIAEEVGLGAVQLHGEESAKECALCRRRVIKAVGLSKDSEVADLRSVSPLVTVLADVWDPVRRGGTGQVVDWSLAATIARQRPMILSGGLRPDNVIQALRQVSPYGLDASSGVELEPGVKSADLMRRFFQEILWATKAGALSVGTDEAQQ